MSLASDYADSVSRAYWQADEAGAVFGYAECDECGAEPNEPCEGTDDGEVHEGREERTAYDFLEDALSIDYVVGADKGYRGAEILVGFGGPNVWVHTRDGNLVVLWDERATRSLPGSMIDALDEAAAEMWESVR